VGSNLTPVLVGKKDGNLYMSTLDMAAAYWQLEIDERDHHKIAFITKYG